MWNDKLEAQAAAEAVAASPPPPAPDRWEKSYPRKLSASGRERRREPLDENRLAAAAAAQARQADGITAAAAAPSLPDVIDPQQLPPRRTLGRPPGTKSFTSEYPLCPQCDGTNIIRRGKPHGYQAYRCKDCRRNFMGKGFRLNLQPVPILRCYRCGGTDCDSLGFSVDSGRTAYCKRCLRRFTQGGRNELARYHLVLEKRIAALGLPADVQSELLQTAYVDVLRGEGYCWNVALRAGPAWKSARGEFLETGSEHPVYRAALGLPCKSN